MHEESRREELSKCKSSPQVAVEAAVLESEIATNRIRGRGDDHIARSARDAADAADGSGPYPGSRTARPTCRRRSGSSPDRWDDEAAHVHLLVDAEVERQLGLHVMSSRLVRRGVPLRSPGGPCKAEGHGWAGRSLRRHRERDVGEARDGVRGLPAGGRRGEAPLGGVSL